MYLLSISSSSLVSYLYTLDLETFEATLIGQGDKRLSSIEFIDNKLYGTDYTDYYLCEIDINDGTITDIGTSNQYDVFQDLSYDLETDLLYTFNGSNFGTVDITTGEFTLISPMIASFETLVITTEPKYTVTFNIDDGTSPLENAGIKIDGETLITDNLGTTTIELESQNYYYTVEMDNYDVYTGNVVVDKSSEIVNITMTLTSIIDDGNSNISIYPNPTTGIFTINNEQLTINNLSILDITGKIIYNEQFTMHNEQLTIDISNLPVGVYFIKIQTDNEIITKKIVKE